MSNRISIGVQLGKESVDQPGNRQSDAEMQLLSRFRIAETSQEFLQVGIQLVQLRHSRVSLSAVCRKAGIPSTGYFSDVLNGKRKIHPKYVDGLEKALSLSPSLATFLTLLVEKEQLKKADTKQMEEVQRAIESQRKLLYLAADYDSAPLAADLHFHMLVYSSFALFGGRPTTAELTGLFGEAQSRRLSDSLDRLLSMQLIEVIESGEQGDTSAPIRYRHREQAILFGQGQNQFSHAQFLTDSFFAAARSVRAWYQRPTESLFTSSIITVNRRHFQRALATVRKKVLEIQTDLDDEGRGYPDSFIRFNIQIYPEEF